MTVGRRDDIDVLKGLAIIAVVLGHTRFVGTNYIYLFHMAVFFMASGFFYKSHYSDSIANVWSFARKKILGLWMPFVIWNTIYTLLNNVFIKTNIYTDNIEIAKYLDESLVGINSYLTIKDMMKNIIKGLFMAGHTGVGGAFWFLRVLFYISIAYVLVDYIAKKIFISEKSVIVFQGCISFICLLIGFFMSINGIEVMAIDIAMSTYFMFYLGHLFSRLILPNKQWLNIIIFLCCAILLYVMGSFGSISVGNNEYENPLFLIVCSVLGWFMLKSISSLLVQVPVLKDILVVVGQNSLAIVIFHFLAFKIVNVIYVLVMEYPLYCVAGFPVSTNKGLWWIAYVVVGVTVPVLLSMGWKNAKKSFQNKE